MRHCRGPSGKVFTAALPRPSNTAFASRPKPNPSCSRIICCRRGLSLELSNICKGPVSRAIERSANTEAIAHLTRALELLRSSDDAQQKRAQFRSEALLSQAMIARYGYAAQKTRNVLLHARTLIEESTEPRISLPSYMGYGLPTTSEAMRPSSVPRLWSFLLRRNGRAIRQPCASATESRHHATDNGGIP